MTRQAMCRAAAACGLLLAGCRGRTTRRVETTRPARPATRQAEAPRLPEQYAEELSAGATEVLVDASAGAFRAEPTYRQEADFPCGKLSGICRFAGPLVRRAPPPEAADLSAGPLAIAEPLAGEVDYYDNIRILRPRYWRWHQGPDPTHVALIFRGITVGRRRPLTPTGFMAIHGYCQGLQGNHGNKTNINFAPPHARVTFFTYEAYPCTFLLSEAATGRQLFSGQVTYKDEGARRARDVGGGHKIWIASKPNHIQSPILHALGRYAVTTRRHPWKVGHLFLVDNPYVEVVGGSFEIDDLPPGRHRMEVWHPAYEPLKHTFEIEISPDATSEVAINFRPPPELLAPPREQKDP